MKNIISGKNIHITDALRNRVEKKMKKFEKFFHPETEVDITLSTQKKRQMIEVTIHHNGVTLRVHEESNDLYTAIDKMVDILERQIRRNKTKLLSKHHNSESIRALSNTFEDIEDIEEEEEEEEFKIVSTKKFPLKPMSIEEAVLQMNLNGDNFFMFSNGETQKVNVVYRRKDSNYGLIEPEF
jgi:putative sigma-54 modulation protein